jgi:hypothetical protein
MIKESKNVDFRTTGRQLSEQEFVRVSEWIKKDKEKRTRRKKGKPSSGKKDLAQQ